MGTYWNCQDTFQDLMGQLTTWLSDKPNITVVHLDWKFVQRASDNDNGWWYLTLIYKN